MTPHQGGTYNYMSLPEEGSNKKYYIAHPIQNPDLVVFNGQESDTAIRRVRL